MPTSVLRRALSPLLALLIAGLASPVSAAPLEEARSLVNAKARVLFMKHRRAIKALESTPLDGRAIATKRVRGWTLVALQG